MASEPLRVAFVAGTLGQGGAEKQLVYQIRALREAGADVRVLSLTRGEHHEREVADLGAGPVWIGGRASVPARLAAAARQVAAYRPHVVQSAHFFTNLYAGMAARASGAVSLAAGRGDLRQDLADTGVWGRPLLASCHAFVANSRAAAAQAASHGRDVSSIHVLPNVIDVEAFDAAAAAGTGGLAPDGRHAIVLGVGSLEPVKRFDLFIAAVAEARRSGAAVEGWIAGDGPERERLREFALREGVLDAGIRFLGRRRDVPSLLGEADLLLLTSDTEGFPNVVLEAMAAGRAVVSTAVGDVRALVAHERTGIVVPVGDVGAVTAALVRLAGDAGLRARWGGSARAKVVQRHGHQGLAARLVSLYRRVAVLESDRPLLAALDRLAGHAPHLTTNGRHPASAGYRPFP